MLGKYGFNPEKTKEQFLEEFDSVYEIEEYSKRIIPMTLEGCVVRISDIIAYIGRDIEDGIIIGDIKREDLPEEITNVLGNNNSKIVDTLIKDVIINSMDKPYLTFTKEVFEALMALKEWNYDNIYNSEMIQQHDPVVRDLFSRLFYSYFEKVKDGEYERKFLDEQHTESERVLYRFFNNRLADNNDISMIKRTVTDYIAGQTDNYFLSECEKYIDGFESETLYR